MKLSLLKTKALALCMLLIAGIMITSCTSNDDTTSGGGGDTPENLADYTVIMMIHPGDVDCYATHDLAQLIIEREEGKIGDNVNVVGIVKPSKDFMVQGKTDSCFIIDLKPKQGLSEDTLQILRNIKIMSNSRVDIAKAWINVFNCLDTKVHCDRTVNINTADSISSFIKQAAALHPAKHYVLIPFGHGSGYCSAYEPTIEAAHTTRACLPDVNVSGTPAISLDELMLGVKNSGIKFQTILTQCCLMATLENMTAYATQFDYFLGSSETTTGGYFYHFVQNLSEAGDDEAKLKDGFKDLVDYYVNFCNENRSTLFPTSYGYYDLKKISALLATVKEAKDWFVEANTKDTIFMRNVLLNTYYTNDADQSMIINRSDRNAYKDIILHPENHADEITVEKIREIISSFLLDNGAQEVKNNFILATMFQAAMDNKATCTTGLDFGKLQTIYDNYIAAVKDMGYINCTTEKDPAMNNTYLYCSPSIQLVGFNEDDFIPLLTLDYNMEYSETEEFKDRVSQALYDLYKSGDEKSYDEILALFYRGNFFANRYILAADINDENGMKMFNVHNIAETYYATEFHKQTGWGDLLRHTVYNPNWYFNPVR